MNIYHLKKKLCSLFLCMVILLPAVSLTAQSRNGTDFRLSPLFADNMVLQRGIPVNVFGFASAGEKISINFKGYYLETITDIQGKWTIKLPVFSAGGPFQMIVNSSSKRILLENVMIGEVWLASGQSNMNFSLDRPMLHSEEEIAQADYPQIREFRVQESVSSHPLDVPKNNGWKVCTPQNARKFSAVAYFFARKLAVEKKVAVGIIHASYGGSPIHSWISWEMLATHPKYKERMINIKRDGEDWASLQEQTDSVKHLYATIIQQEGKGIPDGVFKSNYNDESWKEAAYPLRASELQTSAYSFIWLRKHVDIPVAAAGKDLYLSLGELKMQDITYFNGIEVGRGKREMPRLYKIPGRLVKKGKNVIAVRWLSEWGYGRVGMPGDEPKLYTEDLKVAVPLTGNWKYNDKIEPDLPTASSYNSKPSGLFNAMISPLCAYGIKGILWYQGENDTGNPTDYNSLLGMLLMDWRMRWNQGDMPFLVVQLPNHESSNSGWVQIREAQAQAVSYPNVGMIVTTDIGDPYDVHPINKKPVGERLFLSAMKTAYGEDLVSTGPELDHWTVSGNKVILSFKHTNSGLLIKGSQLLGFELGGRDGHFYTAKGMIEDDRLILESEQVREPFLLQYNWKSNPIGNLFNTDNLPAAPFKINLLQ